MPAKHHTTLPRCDCIGTLRGLYEDPLVQAARQVTWSAQRIKLSDEYRVLAKPTPTPEQVHTPSTVSP
jgi:hypothetical protein